MQLTIQQKCFIGFNHIVFIDFGWIDCNGDGHLNIRDVWFFVFRRVIILKPCFFSFFDFSQIRFNLNRFVFKRYLSFLYCSLQKLNIKFNFNSNEIFCNWNFYARSSWEVQTLSSASESFSLAFLSFARSLSKSLSSSSDFEASLSSYTTNPNPIYSTKCEKKYPVIHIA